MLFDELSVTENIFLGHPIAGRFGLLDWKAMRKRAREILGELEVDLDPDMRLRDLAIARKHLVAIARALSIDARIVIMDEPTASLSHKEVEELYAIVGKLKREGKAILSSATSSRKSSASPTNTPSFAMATPSAQASSPRQRPRA